MTEQTLPLESPAGRDADPSPSRSKALLQIIGYGLACWFVPFAVAMAWYPTRMTHRMLFESAMAVVLAATVVGVMTAYLARVASGSMQRALLCGLIWLAQCLLLDWVAFSVGPMRMPLADYFQDIGVTYLMISILTLGLAWQRRSSHRPGN